MKQWYFRDATQQKIGPLTPEEFEQRVAAGEVTGPTRVWCSGMIDWAAYESVLAHQRTVPPPLPVAAPEPGPVALPAAAPAPVAAGGVTFEDCPQCRERLPSHLFRELAGRRICGNCFRETHAQKQRAKLRLATGVDSNWFLKHLAKVAVVGLLIGFARIGITYMQIQSKQAMRSMPADASKFEPWVQSGPANWPQIALTSEARFRSGGELHGASAFLVEMPDGGCAAIVGAASLATAAVQPPVALHRVGAELVDWRFFPKAHPEQALVLTKVAGDPEDYLGCEAIALPTTPGTPAPALVLQLRQVPLRSGETVFVIVPSADPAGRQVVAKGSVLRVSPGDGAIHITTDLAIPASAIAGGAILDLKGHLAGIAVRSDESPATGAATQAIRGAGVENFVDLLEAAADEVVTVAR